MRAHGGILVLDYELFIAPEPVVGAKNFKVVVLVLG